MNVYLNAHALKVVKSIPQTIDIAAMTHLIGLQIVLKVGPINVIIIRNAIDESVEHNSVEWKSPVSRRSREVMPIP